MMSYTDLFSRCIEVILLNEGGYVNDPDDPGGETNFGITKRDYPDLDIKRLTRNEAIQIYFQDYWSKMNLLGIIDESVVLEVFDMGVNAGPKTAIKIVQRVVGVLIDGVIGPITEQAINTSTLDVAAEYRDMRKKFYFALVRRKPWLHKFLEDWVNRANDAHF